MNERQCILTRQVKPRSCLIRFVRAPDGRVVPDLKGTLPGRGCWVTATFHSVEECVRRGLFARHFSEPVTVSPCLASEVDVLLAKHCLQTLSLFKKAGLVLLGAQQINLAARKNKLSVILHTQEASTDGRRKISQAVYAAEQSYNAPGPRVFSLFKNDEVQFSFGRAIIMHIAVMKHKRTQDITQCIEYLWKYRNNVENHATAIEAQGK